jgi:PAS domain S-box-containing protein
LRSEWFRYGFAAAVSALAWLVFGSFPPFIPALAAVIVSVIWAGPWPGLVSLCIVSWWVALAGNPAQSLFFAMEGGALCAWSARVKKKLHQADESERWHRQLTETTGEGVWVTNEKGVIVYANPRIGEILGISPDKLKGRNIEEFLFPEDIPVERIRNGNRRAGITEQFDRRMRRADGSEAWVLVSGSSLPSRGLLSMMTDITERKHAEQALRRSEGRFRSLFENVLEGVYQSTPEGRILAANPMLLRMLGLGSEAELNKIDIASDLYLDPEIRGRLLERLEREGSFQNVEYALRRRDGRIIRVLENARAVRGDDGAVLYYEGTLADITGTRRAEYGASAADLSSDFSNVLTAVSGYAHLILEDLPASHPAHNTASELLRAVESASALTRRMT